MSMFRVIKKLNNKYIYKSFFSFLNSRVLNFIFLYVFMSFLDVLYN